MMGVCSDREPASGAPSSIRSTYVASCLATVVIARMQIVRDVLRGHEWGGGEAVLISSEL